MQNENNKKVKIKNTIQLPFDGTAKRSDEVAKMIGEALLKRNEEKVDILFPVQWAMSPINILHPEGGILVYLDRNSAINEIYKFTGFARNGAIGVTATRTC